MSSSKAITSPSIERKLGYEIKKVDTAHYLVYRIIIETGIPFEQLAISKVALFRKQKSITYTTRAGEYVTAYFSQDTLETIREHIAWKSDKEYMFPNRYANTPIKSSNTVRTFNECAAKLGIDMHISIAVLKKTYYFHLLQKANDISELTVFKERLHLRSDNEVLAYLGIPAIPQKIKTWDKETYQHFLDQIDQKSLQDRVSALFQSMDIISNENDLPEIFYQKSMESISAIEEILDEYFTFLNKSGFYSL